MNQEIMPDVPVSVIIPTYNRGGDRLAASINSVLSQSHKELEVIVVDDGSTDGTERLVSAMSDSRLRYHHLERNGGVANARNVGVRLAHYDVIAFNDSDDLWHTDKLEAQLKYWAANPEDVLVYCAYKVDIPPDRYVKFPPDGWNIDTLQGMLFFELLRRPAIGTPTMLMTREIFEQAGGFDSIYPTMEDWELSVRISRMGKIGYVNQVLLTVEASASDRRTGATTPAAKLLHYETRCMVLAKYVEEIRAAGRFDLYAGEILQNAEQDGLTEPVKKIMMRCLAERMLGGS